VVYGAKNGSEITSEAATEQCTLNGGVTIK
jgi:hypothetical protein